MTPPTADRILSDEAARAAGGVSVTVAGVPGVFSIARAIHSEATGAGSFEAEVGEELKAQAGGALTDHGGAFLPPSVVFPRPAAALETGTTNGGAELVFTDRPRVSPALRSVSRIEALGATLIRGGGGTVRLVRTTGGSGVTWVPEVPAGPVADDDPSFAFEDLDLSLGIVTTAVSATLGAVNPETAGLVEAELRAAAAEALDEGAVAGAGGDEPTGILSRSDVTTHSVSDPDGGALAYVDLVEIEEGPAASDVPERSVGWLTTPGVRKALRQTAVLATDAAGPCWFGGRILGRRAEVSTAVPSDFTKGAGSGLHGLIYGAAWDALVVHVAAIEIVSDPYSKAKQGLREITCFLHLGVGLQEPASFVRVLDASVA